MNGFVFPGSSIILPVKEMIKKVLMSSASGTLQANNFVVFNNEIHSLGSQQAFLFSAR